jgi:argininosuccinate lyase
VAHLLVIESWLGASSVLLPRAIAELGHRFTFLTRDVSHYLAKPPVPGPHTLLEAERILRSETNDVPELVGFVERLQPVLGFDGVVTTCDYYLEAAAEAARRLRVPGPAPAGVRTARIKHLMRAALDAAGLPSVRHRVVTGWEEAVVGATELGYLVVRREAGRSLRRHARHLRTS